MNKALELEQRGEPPSKKARHVSEENGPAQSVSDESAQKRRSSRRNKNTESPANAIGGSARGSSTKGGTPVQAREQSEEQEDQEDQEEQAPSDLESEMERSMMGEGNDDTVASINGDADGYAVYYIIVSKILTKD